MCGYEPVLCCSANNSRHKETVFSQLVSGYSWLLDGFYGEHGEENTKQSIRVPRLLEATGWIWESTKTGETVEIDQKAHNSRITTTRTSLVNRNIKLKVEVVETYCLTLVCLLLVL